MRARRTMVTLIRFLAIAGALAVFLLACAPGAPSPSAPEQKAAPSKSARTLDQLVQGAKAEGKLSFAGPSNLGDEGAQKLVAALNAKYGTNIQGTYSSTGNLADIVRKVITELATGGTPTWDAVIMNDTYVVPLWTDGYLEKYPYREVFGMPERAISFDSVAVGFANQLVLPVYNTKIVAPADVPKTWEDVVDPKWKGKVAMHNAIHHLVRLSQVWGDEKTTDFTKKFAALNPKMGLINETYQSVVLGEVHISLTQTNSQVDPGKRKGEPVDWAADVRPVIAPTYHCSAIKGAQNPNAAALLCGFMLDKAAQDVWGERFGRQSLFDSSTMLGGIFAKNEKDVVILDEKFALEELEKREKKYKDILGMR